MNKSLKKKGTILKRYIANIVSKDGTFQTSYPAYNVQAALIYFQDKYPTATINIIDWKLV